MVNINNTVDKKNLLVFEYNGTARSGKGTIVKHLTETFDNITSEETGADYRAVTKALITNNQIKIVTEKEEILEKIDNLDIDYLTELATNRQLTLDKYGKESLYKPDVNELVAYVGQSNKVRQAVKAGFKERVKKIINEGKYRALLVDGRNLTPVIETISGATSLLRTFVSCLPIEAAQRECSRYGLELNSKEGKEIFYSIEERNQADAKRSIDPVIPELNAINYWYEQDAFDTTVQMIANEKFDGDYFQALLKSFSSHKDYTDVIRHGVGNIARDTSRQIFFDTTPFRSYKNPKESMLEAASIMFEEAIKGYI